MTDQRDVVAWGERREYLKLAAQYGGYVEDKPAVAVAVPIGITIKRL